MKSFVLLCLLGLLAAAAGTYMDRWDGMDIDSLIKNKRLLDSYFLCLMDKGKCPPEGADLKGSLPEAIQNDCAKCSETQKDKVKVMIKHLINNEPDMWNELCGKYDPDNIYRSKHEEELKELQQ